MKYFKYILRNALRNKLRTALTVASLCVCLALMSILYGYLVMQDQFMPELAKGNRAIVMNIQGFMGRLPIAYLDRIRATDGVKSAVPWTWYLAAYKDERTTFAPIGTDADRLFIVWDECQLPAEQLRAWKENRQGCIVDRMTARRFGWKIGTHIPLKGQNYDYDLDLTLCGIFDGPEWLQGLFFHWRYLDEGLRAKGSALAGNAGLYFVKAFSADALPGICASVDRRFASSECPTWTQTHQAFAQMFSKFLGNLQAYIRNIGLAVVFALTLVAANAMAMSMRERTTEIAVLKAIGFQRWLVLLLILGEAVLTATLGGVLGSMAGQGLWNVGHQMWPQFFPFAHIAWKVTAYAVAVAAGIGLASGVVPALRAAQLSVIDGLRRVE